MWYDPSQRANPLSFFRLPSDLHFQQRLGVVPNFPVPISPCSRPPKIKDSRSAEVGSATSVDRPAHGHYPGSRVSGAKAKKFSQVRTRPGKRRIRKNFLRPLTPVCCRATSRPRRDSSALPAPSARPAALRRFAFPTHSLFHHPFVCDIFASLSIFFLTFCFH